MPSDEGYTDGNLAELQRELDHPAIEIVLRLRHRIEVLQAEIRRLRLGVLPGRNSLHLRDWVDAGIFAVIADGSVRCETTS